MPKIRQIVLDHTIDPAAPPAEQGQVSLSASSYSGNENGNISFNILRILNITQQVRVDWAITNASVAPISGFVTFNSGDTSKLVTVVAGEVGPSEIGQLSITSVTALTDVGNTPAIVSPSIATFTVIDSGAQAWSYIGIPYPTDNVPSAIMPTLPTGADLAGWPYDPCTIAKPVVGDIPDWNNAPNAYYIAYNGNNGTAGNGTRGNPTNPRLSMPAGPFTAGAIIFVEGAGVARPTTAVSGGRNFHEVLGWQSIAITFNSAETYSNVNDICWVVGINDPRVAAFDGSVANSNHFIVDGVIFSHASDSRAGRVSQTNNKYSCYRHGAQYGAGTGSTGVGGSAMGMEDCEFHVYYNQEIAYMGGWLIQAPPDYHGWRPAWRNRWLWCIESHIHHISGDSMQVGNSTSILTIDQNSHYTYFAGNECHDNQENAVDCKNSSHVIVSQNHCYSFTGAGFGDSRATAILLSNDDEGFHSHHHWALSNHIHDTAVGLRVSGNSGTSEPPGGQGKIPNTDGFIYPERDYVIGNLIYDCYPINGGGGQGMIASHGSDTDHGQTKGEHHFINNTVALCTGFGTSINLWQDDVLFDVYIDGNIYYECGTEIGNVGDSGLGLYSVTDNVLYKTGGGESIAAASGGKPIPSTGNVLGTDPLFVNSGANDFRLSSASSPAYNMTNENAVYQLFQDMYGINIKKDYDGVTRPQGAGWDAGAFERI